VEDLCGDAGRDGVGVMEYLYVGARHMNYQGWWWVAMAKIGDTDEMVKEVMVYNTL